MPTYVYKFIDTDETIEVQQAFTEDALTEAVHPQTGATMPVKKVFLPVGVTFKGGGFYKTDSRGGKGAKKSSGSESSSDKSTTDSSSSEKSSSSGEKSTAGSSTSESSSASKESSTSSSTASSSSKSSSPKSD